MLLTFLLALPARANLLNRSTPTSHKGPANRDGGDRRRFARSCFVGGSISAPTFRGQGPAHSLTNDVASWNQPARLRCASAFPGLAHCLHQGARQAFSWTHSWPQPFECAFLVQILAGQRSLSLGTFFENVPNSAASSEGFARPSHKPYDDRHLGHCCKTGDGAQRLSHTDRWLKAPPVSLAPLFMRGQLEALAPSVLSEVANVLGSRQRGW